MLRAPPRSEGPRGAALALVLAGCAGAPAAPGTGAAPPHPRPPEIVLTRPPGGETAPGREPLSGPDRWYRAGARASGPSVGLGAWVSVERPWTSADEHSIAELSAEIGSDARHVVEVGWRVAPGKYGDEAPHLFVFHWSHGKPGCYDGCGFVPFPGGAAPGTSLDREVGRQIALGLVLVDGNWWAWMGDRWIGHFPADLWATRPFVHASFVQWFGEVFTSRDRPLSAMGSGRHPGEDGAASFRALCLVDLARWQCLPAETWAEANAPELYGSEIQTDGSVRYGGPSESLRPRPPPSSASAERLPATGR